MAAEAGVDNDKDGRGIGVGDFDNDGRLEFYQTNADQDSLFYHNVTAPVGHWIELKLVGTRSNRDAIGARVTLKTPERSMIREVDGGNGYAGQSQQRVHFGLGASTEITSLTVRWPSGLRQEIKAPMDRITTITEPSSAKSR
jgi:hypothetical protein